MHKHSQTCKKGGKDVCRFGFPLPPLEKTMILEPLDADVDKYRKVFYKYPSCSLENFEQHVNTHLKPLTEHQKDLVLVGDFNFDLFAGHTDF